MSDLLENYSRLWIVWVPVEKTIMLKTHSSNGDNEITEQLLPFIPLLLFQMMRALHLLQDSPRQMHRLLTSIEYNYQWFYLSSKIILPLRVSVVFMVVHGTSHAEISEERRLIAETFVGRKEATEPPGVDLKSIWISDNFHVEPVPSLRFTLVMRG